MKNTAALEAIKDHSAFLASVQARCLKAVKHGKTMTPKLVAEAMEHTLAVMEELIEGKTESAEKIREHMAREIWEAAQA